MGYLIGIDIGTGGTKTVLFDQAGRTICSAAKEYGMAQPQNGWAEQNPEDWWDAVLQTIRTVTMGIDPSRLVGLGLTGQMHGLVMLDGDCRVLRPAILWCDSRSGRECEELTGLIGRQKLLSITANPAVAGFTASKLLWVKKQEPALFARCRHILLPKDYVRFRLTGTFQTDVSDASGTQLLDVANRRWSAELLGALGLREEQLAAVSESAEPGGTLSREAARLSGLPEGLPVAAGAGDNAAAAVGTGVVEHGNAFATIGTSGVVFAHTDRMLLDPKGRIHTFCSAVPGKWHVMGVTQAAGLSLKWMRDTLCGEECAAARQLQTDPYALLDREAANAPIGANRLLFLPYLMGERTPHLDPNARGAFLGLSAMHEKRDLVRAVMEGVSFSLRDCLEVLAETGVTLSALAVCGGGASSPFWRQMLADVFGLRVETKAAKEGPALGAAILAGVAAGAYASVEAACRELIQTARAIEPDPAAAARYDALYPIYRSLYPALRGCYDALAELP